jgi:hypothetical protein
MHYHLVIVKFGDISNVKPLSNIYTSKATVGLTLSAYTICYRPLSPGEGISVPEPPGLVTLESKNEQDDEMFYISEPSASKYPDFARDVSGDPHGITH